MTARTTTSALPAAPSTTEKAQQYVTVVYEDLFGRDPDPEGLSTWTAALLSGTPRVAVANAITSSDEFRTELITDSYGTYLGREPDPAGLQFWLGKMASGWTTSQIESGFLASTEYFPRLDTATTSYNFEWVGQLYVSVLGRHPSLDDQLFWTHRTSMFGRAGLTRMQVAMDFLLSSENLATVVDGYYETLLGRSMDPSGQATWVRILQAGGRDETIIGAIIASDEYWGNVPSPA